MNAAAPARVAILKRRLEARGKSLHVFPGARPSRPLGPMALKQVMKKLARPGAESHASRAQDQLDQEFFLSI